MSTNRRIAIGIASLIGVAVVGYLGWWAYKKYRTSSSNAVKNNRDIQVVRS